MLDLQEIEKQLKEFDKIMHEYYRQVPIEEANASITKVVDEFNNWVKRVNSKLEAKHSELQGLIESIRTLEANMADMDRKLEAQQSDPDDSSSLSIYNNLVKERNSLVQEHEKLAQKYRQKEGLYNQRVNEFDQERERRKAQVEQVKKEASNKAETYKKWIKADGPLQFSNRLNILYATLIQERRSHKRSDELAEYTGRVRRIRKELGARTKLKEDSTEEGIHIVQAMLCQLEECYLMVDSGASVTSITPEMVDVLGIRQHVGEKVEIVLPNAIRIKAPQLVIPKIAVDDSEADYIKAVVLKESMPGVDGCLGLSFLNRFDYTIDRKGLRLEPFKPTAERPRFDVFICHKSDDFSAAKEVFDLLVESGYRPFLGELSLAEYRTTDYQKAVDATLEDAEHLVVVASSRSNIETPWVEAEWRLFEYLKRSGRKQGNIIPLLSGDMKAEELPPALGRYQALSMNGQNWKMSIINYLPRYRVRGKGSL